jgi:tetratricopeptide (TPR) repeat protein
MELDRRKRAHDLLDQGLRLLGRAKASGRDTRSVEAFLWLASGIVERQLGRRAFRQSLERSLDLARRAGDQWGIAASLSVLADVDLWSGDYEEARRELETCVAIGRDLGDERRIANANIWLAWICVQEGHVEEGEQLARETLPMLRASGGPREAVAGLLVLAGALGYGGKYAEAQSRFEERQAVWNELGIEHPFGLAMLGWVKLQQGHYDEALTHLCSALDRTRDGSGPLVSGICQLELARMAVRDAAYAEARQLLIDSVRGLEAYVVGDFVARAHAVASCAAQGLGEMVEARTNLVLALRWAAERRSYLALVEALPVAALMLLKQGEIERAVEIYELAGTLSAVANSRWNQDVIGRPIAQAAEALAPEVVAAAKERGRARDMRATLKELAEEFNN